MQDQKDISSNGHSDSHHNNEQGGSHWLNSFKACFWEPGATTSIGLAKSTPDALWQDYKAAFSADYQALYSPTEAMLDVARIEQLTEEQSVLIDWRFSRENKSDHPNSTFHLLLYKLGGEISLSESLPVLENTGLHVFTEQSTLVQRPGKPPVHLRRYLVKVSDQIVICEQNMRDNVAPGLAQVFLKTKSNDALNSLMLSAKLSPKAISILRCYAALLGQITPYARSTIQKCLAQYHDLAAQLWHLFDNKLNPDSGLSASQRRTNYRTEVAAFRESLRHVSAIAHDRILRSISSLLTHTVRTNFYQATDTIAIKLRSNHIDIMPNPRPLYEVFIHSAHIQGTHLRTGMIARGGLRWSERPEDFRSEVLGLMKTQKVKNALIVPEGAKGGFIVRQLPEDATEKRTAVENAYKEYIRALLSLTDNRKNGEIIHPDRVVVLDGPDPYLVVAADKGTATFSDIANRIAVDEYNFWLGDAFASGGSQGYDHKKYGITARGAWECVIRHFKDAGRSIESAPITAVGIGDLAGDVFGNGLIHSDNIQLLAAFNHAHIFVDPTPNCAQSYKERLRMFNLPRSQWSDYDKNTLSAGGGIFGRFDKEIPISKEMRVALSIADTVPDVLNGEELISHILKAKVDLLWNGGIGTYVKASTENNAEVNDGTNDSVRVNATELRSLIVGEGGNLGFTQKARIEFARCGGRINTDAIDNSGGVDLSDHEVNLKILFADIVRQGKLTIAERNALLEKISGDVVADVLTHNRSHALTLSLGEKRSQQTIAYYRSLIIELHRRGYIDRTLENLPDDETLQERAAKHEGLTRPEIAVCLAAVKLSLKEALIKSELPKDPILKSYLLSYFPEELRVRFAEEIMQHPLALHIISSQISNELLADTGVTFVHRMCLNKAVAPIAVVKCALAASIVLEIPALLSKIKVFDNDSQSELYQSIRSDLGSALRNCTSWFITYYGTSHTLAQMVALFKDAFAALLPTGLASVIPADRAEANQHNDVLSAAGLNQTDVTRIALTPYTLELLETLWAASEGKQESSEVARVYVSIVELLGLHQLLTMEKSIRPATKWDNELLVNSYDEIRRSISKLTLSVFAENVAKGELLKGALTECTSYEQLQDTLTEMRSGTVNAAAISVIAKQLRIYKLATADA
jgi:glutamate dehydrogenase